MFLAAVERTNDDGGEGVCALEPHEMIGIKLDSQDVGAFAMGDQVAPHRAACGCQRRGGDLEVDRVIRIGENEQFVAAVMD